MPRNDPAALRRRLVRDLERRDLIRTGPVRDAFLAVPRELFVPEFAAREGLEAVYGDDAIVTKVDDRGLPISSSSQPGMMAAMLEELALEPGMNVLEIGAGTGYNAALLSRLVGKTGSVTSIDVDEDVARGARSALQAGNVRTRIVVGDGRDGFAEHAPYDRILVTASTARVPRAWLDQLADGGLLELPLRTEASGAQIIPTLQRRGATLISIGMLLGGFMPLRGGEERPDEQAPCLLATDAAGSGPGRPLAQISGPGLSGLTDAAKRRLLGAALTEGRRRALGLRADARALLLYLTLTLPPARLVTVFPGWKVGVVGSDGSSLAYVESRTQLGARWIGSLTAHGEGAAEEALLDAVREWDRRGRPGPEDLRVAVVFGSGTEDGTVDLAWPAARRAGRARSR